MGWSMGSQKIRHDWATEDTDKFNLSTQAFIPSSQKKMEKDYMFKDRNPDFWPEPSAGLALIYLLNKHFIDVLSINI